MPSYKEEYKAICGLVRTIPKYSSLYLTTEAAWLAAVLPAAPPAEGASLPRIKYVPELEE